MHYFSYKNHLLHCEDVNLEQLAQEVGSPTYVYSKATILNHYKRLQSALSPLNCLIEYAVKACSNIAILQIFAKEGAGFDIVSGGELFRVIQAGGNPALCTFAGVGKTEKEIRYALEQGIYSFNVESQAELEQINRVAGELGRKAPVALRINPHVDAKTHKYITTGKAENKFGIDLPFAEEAYAQASLLPHIQLKGLQMHIGSQLTEVAPFVEAIKKVSPLVQKLKKLYALEYFSIGGGIGIVYPTSLESGNPEWWQTTAPNTFPLTFESYAEEIIPLLLPLEMKIIVEPGRVLVGNAGALLTECLYEKKGTSKTFKIVDAGFNDLLRPALYEGHHQIVPVKESPSDKTELIDLVGPICETGDFFAQNRPVGEIHAGDYVALLSAGAYGFSMSSNYNSRPMTAEVLVDGDKYHVIRRRQTWQDLIAGEELIKE